MYDSSLVVWSARSFTVVFVMSFNLRSLQGPAIALSLKHARMAGNALKAMRVGRGSEDERS